MDWREQLLNGLQAASNSIAGNLSGPVDILNAGLGLLGLPVSEAPVGGSAWMAQRGLTRATKPGASQVIGETAGLLGPTLTAAYAPQIARGLLAAGDAMPAASVGARVAPNQDGKIVWHGSPHKFDRFDASKIGTGEGAQVYGLGHYTAEAKDVADSYAGKLSRKQVEIPGYTPDSDAAKAVLDRLSQRANSTQYGSGASAAMDDLRSIARHGNPAEKAAASAMLDHLGPFRRPDLTDSGSLYKIDLADSAIPKMLDWDSPVAESVRKKVSEAAAQKFGSGSTGSSGRLLYDELSAEFKRAGSKSPAADAAEFLRQQGVPGIRYLDAGSRGATEGTYNYVVFPGNEGLLSILERNGVPVK